MDLSSAAIRRAVVPAGVVRRVNARRGLEQWLRETNPQRYGLPASAIVVVRELRVTWARVSARAGSFRDDPLGAVLYAAGRPARQDGALPDTPAVWFADEAEMLACMAGDALAGALNVRWWWPVLLRQDVDCTAAIRHWAAAPRVVPRAIEQLNEMGVGAAWFESWDGPSRHALLAALVRHHPISAPVQGFVEASQAAAAPGAWPEREPNGDDPAPLRAPAPSPSARLHRLCLDLARDPGCASDERYVERTLHRDLRPALETDRRSSTATAPSPIAPGSLPGPTPLAAAGIPPTPPRSDVRVSDRVQAPVLSLATAVTTRHGGLFFVINAALQLGLYGDFSRPQHRRLAMSPWRFLYETGLAFGRRRFARDPLAAWLKEWGGEAAGLEPAASWRIERDWLRAFEDDVRPLCAVVEAGRLTLLHAAGFPVCQVPATSAHCDEIVATQLAALGLETRAVVHIADSAAGSRRATKAAGSGALTRVLPYLRARLGRALALRDARRMPGLLLRLPAGIRVSGDRVDVFFALQQLPIAVRLAGLDRNPGWIPAAGRDLRFHFD